MPSNVPVTSEPTADPVDFGDLADRFEVDGAVCVRGLVGPELLDRVSLAVEANLAAPSPLAIVASAPDDPGHFVEDFCNWHRFDASLDLARHVSPVARALVRAAEVRLYHDHLLVKEAGTVTPTPWHQDQPYYDVEGGQVVSMWCPLDPVPRSSTLEFVAGSHQGPWLMPRTFLEREARWFGTGELAEVPDVDADRSAHRILGWSLEPGDVVFFHALTLHASAGSATRRRVLSLRFIGPDVVRVERPWRTSPPIARDAVFPLV